MNNKILTGVFAMSLFAFFNREYLSRELSSSRVIDSVLDYFALGIRNNNPMNIKHGNSKWVGMSSVQDDAIFVQFDSPMFGLRAGARLLLNYQNIYYLSSVRSIITKWAPASDDNPTNEYADYVAEKIGVDPDMFIRVEDHLAQLLPAMVQFENGDNPYKPEIYREAINDALNG